MSPTFTLRPATSADAPAVLAIYAPIVERTAISFELTPPALEEVERRIASATARHPWIVASDPKGALLGYAYAATFRARAAYTDAVESTVYVAERARRAGVARALMLELLARLRDAGVHVCVAGVALPNDASLALHRSLGFQSAGTLPEVGVKFGRRHDMHFLTLLLRGNGGA